MPSHLRNLWNRLANRSVSQGDAAARRRLIRQQGAAARSRRRFLFEPLEDRRVMAVTFIDPNPAPGNQFGHSVVALSTGNVVITSPFDDAGGVDAGAVYLFNGSTGALISTLRGSTDFDLVGRTEVIPLANGNFVVSSNSWHKSPLEPVGAVTFGDGTFGVNGVVSAANSLVGNTSGDMVGDTGKVVALPSGNFIVMTPSWDNGANADVGAITWVDGTVGITGTISSANSLTGTNVNDRVGSSNAKVLANGHVVVTSTSWNANAGAVTWINGFTGVVGTVSSANSLIGGSANDEVGSRGILELTNGNYVVMSPNWDNAGVANVGAATWANGSSGIVGTVSAANSLVGSTAEDNVGVNFGAALTNGNYVVTAPNWDGGGFTDAGAAIWGSGTAGVKGVVSAANALVGSKSGDKISVNGVLPLTNGNYVVVSPYFDNGAAVDTGAVTWGNGNSGTTGNVNSTNSLVGTASNDFVGASGVVALSNGNYVVASSSWDNGAQTDVGAVTWGNGSSGTSGAVSTSNSTYGGSAGDLVGVAGVTALTNGNYVFGSLLWKNAGVAVGAVTWRNGSSSSSGTVTSANSLIGSTAQDFVGDFGSMKALPNGNYVVLASNWDAPGAVNAGAVTWGNGSTGIFGTISSSNSLVGSTAEDKIGNNGIAVLAGSTSSNYVVMSTQWDNAGVANVGAVTWSSGTAGRTGAVNSSNSLIGTSADDRVGLSGIVALSNGNYVVSSELYDGGQTNAGAVSWSSGTSGVVGQITTPTVNHVKGTTSDTKLASITLDPVNGNFFARFVAEGSGTIRVGSQSAGFDAPIASSLTAAFSGANLTVTDSDGSKNNVLTVSLVNISGTDYYEFTDAAEAFSTAPITIPASTLSNSNRTLRVPASAMTGSLTVNLLGGNDLLQLNLSTGDVVPPNGLIYNGGAPTAGTADKLLISGGNQGNVTYNYTNPSDGNVQLTNFGTITYTGLEQTLQNTGTTADVTMNLPTGGTNTVSFTDDAASGNGMSRMAGTTFLPTEFANPAGLTLNYGTPADAVTFNAVPDFSGTLVLGTVVFPFSSITFAAPLTLAAGKNLSAFSAGAINLSTTNSDINLSGAGTLLLSTAKNINLVSGSSITLGTGSMTLDANQQAVATTGNFNGIVLNNAQLASAAGAITVRGRGGNDVGGNQLGVQLLGGAKIGTGTLGTVTVQGTGGVSSGNGNYGVQVTGVNSVITSGGGNVVVTGTGGGSGSSTTNTGVSVEGRGVITAGGTGAVSVTGNGSATTGANIGVSVNGVGSQIGSAGGAVSVTGTGTGSTALVPAVNVSAAGTITAGGTGSVTVNGTSNGLAQNSYGVYVTGSSSQINSLGGNVSVNGTGGGSTTATQGYGVFVDNAGMISAGGTGTVAITGTGRNTSGSGGSNDGVVIGSNNSTVTSNGGNISITGIAGGGGSSSGNVGIAILNSGQISSTAAAVISLTGTGGGGSGGLNHGVSITDSGSQVSAGSGGLTILGTPGTGSTSVATNVANTAFVTEFSSGNIDIIGDSFSIDSSSSITASTTSIILRPKTAGLLINIGGSDSAGTLGLADAELDRLTANLVQIGDATTGNISVTATITSPNSVSLTTNGEIVVLSAVTMAASKNFTGVATQAVRFPNSVSDLSTSGTGTINISTARNILLSSGSSIITANGNLDLSANLQATATAASFTGIELISAVVQSTGSGQVTVTGRGGAVNGTANLHGVSINSAGALITSGGGNVRVIGTGGGIGTSQINYGVYVSATGVINAGGLGTVTVDGFGGNNAGTGGNNFGVIVDGTNSKITSNGGAVTVTGRGGSTTSGSPNNIGVLTSAAGEISAGGLGLTTVTGFGGGLAGGSTANYGVQVSGKIGSGGGNVKVTGTGGGAGASGLGSGIEILGGQITAAGSGTVTVEGYGGNLTGTGGANRGIELGGSPGSAITSNGGNVTVTAVGGGGPNSSDNVGLSMSVASLIAAGGTGVTTITTTGGLGSAGGSYALDMISTGTRIGGGNGGVVITANVTDGLTTAVRMLFNSTISTTGSGAISLSTNGLQLESGATLNAGSNALTIKPTTAATPLNLGGSNAFGTLAIDDAEFDLMTAGTINLGDTSSGAVTISQPMTRATATTVTINSAAAINFTTGSLSTAGGNALLNPGTLVSPAVSGVDVSTGAGTLSFGTGDDLQFNVSGLTVDTQYQQLNVAGVVNLTGVDLSVVGSLIASGGEILTIINNDGTDAVVGTFTGLNEGDTIAANFLGSGFSATISYVGGTGNDVVIILGNPPGTTDVAVVAGNLVITDVAGGNTDDSLTISMNGPNIRIQDPANILTALAGAIFVNTHTIEVPLASISGNLQLDTQGGNDSVTINFAAGNPIPSGGMLYSGGSGTNDSLTLTAGSTTTVTHTVTNTSDGQILLAGALGASIAYTGVEPIVDGLLAADRIFTLNGGTETIALADATGTLNLLTSTLGHNITFANPSASLTIDAAGGHDTININSVDAEGPFTAALSLIGGTGDDTVNISADINFAAGRNLDLDLQNDAVSPGADTINIAAGANLLLAGNGLATLKASRTVTVATGASVVTVDGALLVEGNQQTTPSTGNFAGVLVDGGALQSSGTGTLTVRGRGGNDSGGLQFGVFVTNAGAIRGGTTGTAIVQGTGGASVANQNLGVRVFGDGSLISSLGANVQVTGTGGGTGSSSSANRGVDVESNGPGTATISAGASGNVLVTGTGSSTRLSPGVRVAGIGGLITSTLGNVQVVGQGGSGTFGFDVGVWVNAGTINSGLGGGTVTVQGTGGTSPNGTNYGVYLQSLLATTGKITSGGGALQVTGVAGNGSGGQNIGVFIGTGGEISAPPVNAMLTNPLTITGTGGQGSTGVNMGVLIGGKLNSTDQNVTVTGTGGEGTQAYGIGIDQATIAMAGAGVLHLQGVATTAGVLAFIIGHPSTTTSLAHTGTGAVEIAANTVHIESTATITNSQGQVSIAPTTSGRNINLGSTTDSAANTLELSDAELDRITANTLQLGDPNSGPVTISAAITRTAATIVNVDSAGVINFAGGSLSSGGGNMRLNAGTDITPITAGLDVGPGATGTLAFGIGDRLVLNIAGTTVDSQYQQLNVAGQVDLTAVQLVITGTLPDIHDSFVIVTNDGTDPVIGTFNGMPEGTMVNVNGIDKRLTYVGGDGNDVVLLAGNVPPTINPISDLVVNEDAPQQTVNLSGITPGAEVQAIMITASSSVPTLIPTPTITYTSPSATGTLKFTPAPNEYGSATITVNVRDAGQDGNFNTADDAVTTTSFLVTVNSVNDAPTFNILGNQGVTFNSPAQTVNNFATAISVGPSNETGQAIAFTVTGNTNPGLFAVPPAISPTGTLTYTPAANVSGNSTITISAQDSGGTANGGVDVSVSRTFVITIGPEFSLRVTDVTPTTTGVIVTFNRPVDPNLINLYDTQTGSLGPADVVLTRAGSQSPIRGSIVFDPSNLKFTFIATSGRLPADDYTLTLRSAANSFVDSQPSMLDGNGDNIPGDNAVINFTVQPTSAVTISMPNFARGPNQSVNLPANGSGGIPVSFSDGNGLLSASFQILYDPALISFTGATLAAGLPVGSSVSAFAFTPGVLDVDFVSSQPLPAGTTQFMNLLATIPSTAPYRTKQILDITNITLSDNTPAIDDDALAIVAYFGDVTANGAYSSQDASLVARLAVGLDSGLQQFKMLDPMIIADINGNGAFTAQDTSKMLQAAVGIAVPEIPALPQPAISLAAGGPDPKLSIPRDLTAAPGQTLNIPVNIDSIVDLTGNGLESADLVLYYDPTVIQINRASLGGLLTELDGWMVATRIDPLAGRIFVSVASTTALEGRFAGELVKLSATVLDTAKAGASPINLAANSREFSRVTQLNEGWLTLIPAPTDSANDAIDGLLTITGTASAATPQAQLVNGRLLVTGTDRDDQLLISPLAGGTQVIVRANNRILGRFDMPTGIAVDVLSGHDLVYVDDSLPATVIATSPNDAALGIAADIIRTGSNSQLVNSPVQNSFPGSGGEFVGGSESGATGQSPNLSPNDLALLQLLDQWMSSEDQAAASVGRRRK